MAEASSPVVCPACGARNPAAARACGACGEPLAETAVTGARPAPPRPDDAVEDRPRRPAARPAVHGDDEDDAAMGRKMRNIARPEGDYHVDSDTALGFVVPVGVSGWALAAGYLGLIGCIPILGVPFALLGILFGVIAIVHRRTDGSYGAITGNVRAVIGIALGLLGLLASAALVVISVIS